MTTTNTLQEFLVSEDSDPLNEFYTNREAMSNGPMRKILGGHASDLVRQLNLKLDAVKNRRDCEIFINDVEDILDDLRHHESYRQTDRTGAYMRGAAVGGALLADRGHSAQGALIGLGVGLLAAHLVKDDAADHVNVAYREISLVRDKAKDKMLALKK